MPGALTGPHSVLLVLGVVAVVLLIVSGSGMGFLFIPLPFVTVPVAAVGVLWLPRSRRTATGEGVSRG